MRFFIYHQIVILCRWLASVADKGVETFDYCEACGEQKWTSRGCAGRVITYKAVR